MAAKQDPYNLNRFLEAQEPLYAQVEAELRNGRKTSHWMWFVFPQIAGLGGSYMSRLYAISGREEARAYASHPVLGARLRECTSLVNAVEGRSLHQIFGSPDDMKFHSSVTLFALCADEPAVFQEALSRWFQGQEDMETLRLLG